MPHNHDKKYSNILEYLIDLNFLKTMLPDHGMYCELQLLSLSDFSFTVPCFLVILTFFILLEKYLKIIHKTCWHIYNRPPIGVTPSECLTSCKMCSDKISLKLGMMRTALILSLCDCKMTVELQQPQTEQQYLQWDSSMHHWEFLKLVEGENACHITEKTIARDTLSVTDYPRQ